MKKKTLSLALALTLCLSLMTVPASALASAEVVKSFEGYLEVNTGSYSEGMMGFFSRDRNGSHSYWTFIDGKGNTVIEGPFRSVKDFSEGLAAAKPDYTNVKDDQGWGYIDKNGNWVIKPTTQFNNVWSFHDGVARVQDTETGNYGIIDKTGKVVVPFVYGRNYGGAYLNEASDGMILAYNAADGYYGYYDTTGKVALPFQFTRAEDFHAGYAKVCLNGRYTYIDKTGRDIIPQQYDTGYERIERVKVDGEPAALFKVYDPTARDNRYYLLNGSGQVVAGPYSNMGNEFSCGLMRVEKIDGKSYLKGYINTAGQEVVPCGRFYPVSGTNLPQFVNGYAQVSTSGSDQQNHQVIINTAGQIVMSLPQVEGRGYGTFAEGLIPVSSNASGRTRCGVMNTSGQLVVDYKYQRVGAFSNGFAVVTNFEDKRGLINTAGQEVVPCKYASIGEFINGVAVVGEAGPYRTLYGLINTAGQEILPCHYESGLSSAVTPVLKSGDKDVCAVLKTNSANFFLVHITTDATPAQPEKPVTPVTPAQPEKPLAKAGNQDIEIDGTKVAFQTYMLADADGNGTNYVKLRDIAHVLNGTGAQFSVGYSRQEQSITATTGAAYKDTGTEMDTPFAGADKEYAQSKLTIVINGTPVQLESITLADDAGNGYNYFKLRDLGDALGFNVGYSRARGVYVETK